MFNYLIKIEYVGTNFVGWQSQKNGKSIQDSVEKALTRVLKSQIRVIGSGRTDRGVHALSQYANFKSKIKINEKKIFLNSVNFFFYNCSCNSFLENLALGIYSRYFQI